MSNEKRKHKRKLLELKAKINKAMRANDIPTLKECLRIAEVRKNDLKEFQWIIDSLTFVLNGVMNLNLTESGDVIPLSWENAYSFLNGKYEISKAEANLEEGTF